MKASARFLMTVLLIAALSLAAFAQEKSDAELQRSVDELRSSIGQWKAVTEFLNEDGTVAKTVEGTYEFSWVIPDRVVSGKSEIRELGQVSAILLYINEKKRVIEMSTVGADGNLWIMTGPLGGNQRTSQEFATPDGLSRLRFTRYNATGTKFESKMEYTEDRGKSWKPGNHQTFRRSGGGE